MFIQKNLTLKKQYFVNNEVIKIKIKNTLLFDFMKIYKSIHCDNLYCSCKECSNKNLCDTVEDVIKNIGGLYNENGKNFT